MHFSWLCHFIFFPGSITYLYCYSNLLDFEIWSQLLNRHQHLRCHCCEAQCPYLWACLSCSLVGCHKHFSQHYVANQSSAASRRLHAFCINITTLDLWCHECQAYLTYYIEPSYLSSSHIADDQKVDINSPPSTPHHQPNFPTPLQTELSPHVCSISDILSQILHSIQLYQAHHLPQSPCQKTTSESIFHPCTKFNTWLKQLVFPQELYHIWLKMPSSSLTLPLSTSSQNLPSAPSKYAKSLPRNRKCGPIGPMIGTQRVKYISPDILALNIGTHISNSSSEEDKLALFEDNSIPTPIEDYVSSCDSNNYQDEAHLDGDFFVDPNIHLQATIDPSSSDPQSRFNGICGLYNLGNTCFLNATLQSLTNIPLLRLYFDGHPIINLYEFAQTLISLESSPSSSHHPSTKPLPPPHCRSHFPRIDQLVKDFVELTRAVWSRKYVSFKPEKLLVDIWRLNPMFQGYGQQDSQECLRILLDSLHDHLKVFDQVSIPLQMHCMQPLLDDVSNQSINLVSTPTNSNDNSSFNKRLSVGQVPVNNYYDSIVCQTGSEADENDSMLQLDSSFDEDSQGVRFLDATLSKPSSPFISCTSTPHSQLYHLTRRPRRSFSPSFNSPISSLFEGTLLSQVKCLKCGQFSNTFNIFFDLSISIAYDSSSYKQVERRKRELEKLDKSKYYSPSSSSCYPSSQSSSVSSSPPLSFQHESPDSDPSSTYTQDLPSSSSKTMPKPKNLFLSIISFAKRILNYSVYSGYLLSILSHGTKFTPFRSSNNSVPDRTINLVNSLHYLCSREELNGEDHYHCDHCNSYVDAQKALTIYKLPPVVCFHLNRFRHNYFGFKLSDHVEFPLVDLDLTPFCISSFYAASADESLSLPHHSSDANTENISNPLSPPMAATHIKVDQTQESDSVQVYQQQPPIFPLPKYNLVSLICHQGLISGGHYISYAYNSEAKQWYKFDDHAIELVTPQVVASAQAYILFYQQQHLEAPDRQTYKYDLLRRITSHVQTLKQSQENYLDILRLTDPSLMHDIASQPSCIELLEKSVLLPLIWLHQWIHMINPGPIRNLGLMCCHGKLIPGLSVNDLLKLVIPIPCDIYTELVAIHQGEALDFFQMRRYLASPCPACLLDNEER